MKWENVYDIAWDTEKQLQMFTICMVTQGQKAYHQNESKQLQKYVLPGEQWKKCPKLLELAFD